MYLKLRGTGFGNPFYKYHVSQRGEIGFMAKTPHSGMMFTDVSAHVGCYTLVGVGV